MQPPRSTDQDRGGGLGLNNPVREADIQFQTSVKVTAPLVRLVLQQSRVYPTEAMAELSEIKSEIRQEKQCELASTEASVFETLPNSLKRAEELASEKRVPPAGSQPFP